MGRIHTIARIVVFAVLFMGMYRQADGAAQSAMSGLAEQTMLRSAGLTSLHDRTSTPAPDRIQLAANNVKQVSKVDQVHQTSKCKPHKSLKHWWHCWVKWHRHWIWQWKWF